MVQGLTCACPARMVLTLCTKQTRCSLSGCCARGLRACSSQPLFVVMDGRHLVQTRAQAYQALINCILKLWLVIDGADTLFAMQAVFLALHCHPCFSHAALAPVPELVFHVNQVSGFDATYWHNGPPMVVLVLVKASNVQRMQSWTFSMVLQTACCPITVGGN